MAAAMMSGRGHGTRSVRHDRPPSAVTAALAAPGRPASAQPALAEAKLGRATRAPGSRLQVRPRSRLTSRPVGRHPSETRAGGDERLPAGRDGDGGKRRAHVRPHGPAGAAVGRCLDVRSCTGGRRNGGSSARSGRRSRAFQNAIPTGITCGPRARLGAGAARPRRTRSRAGARL